VLLLFSPILFPQASLTVMCYCFSQLLVLEAPLLYSTARTYFVSASVPDSEVLLLYSTASTYTRTHTCDYFTQLLVLYYYYFTQLLVLYS